MIDKKWKWVARDMGVVTLFTYRPKFKEDTEYNGYFCEAPDGLFDFPQGHEENSLHEIIHHEDGKIEFRKARPELKVDDPVLVKLRRSTQWSRRHFACWDEKNGLIRCWDEGRTSFTSEGINSVWDDYKLP